MFPAIAGDTIAITFVGYAVSVSLAMIYADKHGYSIHPNQVKCRNVTARFLQICQVFGLNLCFISGAAGSWDLQHSVILFYLLP